MGGGGGGRGERGSIRSTHNVDHVKRNPVFNGTPGLQKLTPQKPRFTLLGPGPEVGLVFFVRRGFLFCLKKKPM